MVKRIGARGGHFGRDIGPLRAVVASGEVFLPVGEGVHFCEGFRIELLSCGHVQTAATWSTERRQRRCGECHLAEEQS